jgi:DNA-binding LacI/PurR family transcriptional regulator
MHGKRVTIYDLAKELGISASYTSKALNNHPSISEKVKEKVKKKAKELNYVHNSYAANLRQGSSKTIGVIVPQINQGFFSDVIAGIEETCFEHNHNLIICQSHESYKQECNAIETLINQNVDCILISISTETKSTEFLESIEKNNIALVQFDRYIEKLDSYIIVNDNKKTSYDAVERLIKGGYKKIAFLGGPTHLTIFKDRKDGYLKAIKKHNLTIPNNFIVDNVLSSSKEEIDKIVKELLGQKKPPDAFFCVADLLSLGVLRHANLLGIKIPDQLGILGYANDAMTELFTPSLSSINQNSKELGKRAAYTYFEKILNKKTNDSLTSKREIIGGNLIIRQSCR